MLNYSNMMQIETITRLFDKKDIIIKDELEEAKQNGLLTKTKIFQIEKYKNVVLANYRSFNDQNSWNNNV